MNNVSKRVFSLSLTARLLKMNYRLVLPRQRQHEIRERCFLKEWKFKFEIYCSYVDIEYITYIIL